MVLRRLAPCLALLTLALPQSAAAAPTWLSPKNLSVSGNGGDLNVAVDAAGDAFAAWTRSGTVQAAQRPAGGTGVPLKTSRATASARTPCGSP